MYHKLKQKILGWSFNFVKFIDIKIGIDQVSKVVQTNNTDFEKDSAKHFDF